MSSRSAIPARAASHLGILHAVRRHDGTTIDELYPPCHARSVQAVHQHVRLKLRLTGEHPVVEAYGQALEDLRSAVVTYGRSYRRATPEDAYLKGREGAQAVDAGLERFLDEGVKLTRTSLEVT